MRIEALRIRNLASLAGTQPELLFGPKGLAGGLVAVTGSTGSGKSTILDALCLALFGSTPRFEAHQGHFEGPIENHILTRGASDAFAEVDFYDKKNRHLRARWSVAATKTGKLNRVANTLVHLDTSESLAQNKSTMKLAIQESLGMDFRQFNGVVVLSQGSFSAFLRGNSQERSELLQRLTGTSIYEELSKAAHYDHSSKKGILEQNEASVQGLMVMNSEALQQLHQQQQELNESAVALKMDLDRRRILRFQLGELLLAQKSLAKLRVEESKLAQQIQSTSAEQGRLDESQRCEPLRQPLEVERKAQADLSAQDLKTEQLRQAVLQQKIALELGEKSLLKIGQQAKWHLTVLQQKLSDLAVYAKADEATCQALRQLLQAQQNDEQSRLAIVNQLTKLRGEISSLEKNKLTLQESLNISENTLAASEQELVGYRELLKTWVDQNGDAGLMQAAIEKIRQAGQVLSDYKSVQIEIEQQKQQLITSAQNIAQFESLVEGLGLQLTERQQADQDSQQMLQRLLRVANLVGHRQLLRIGEACPLCESTVERLPNGQIDHEIAGAEEACKMASKRCREIETELREADKKRNQALIQKEGCQSLLLRSEETFELQGQRLSTLLVELGFSQDAQSLRIEDLEKESQQRKLRLQAYAEVQKSLTEGEARKESVRSSAEKLRRLENELKTQEAAGRAKDEQLQRQELDLENRLSRITAQLKKGLEDLAQGLGQAVGKNSLAWLDQLSKLHREWKESQEQCRERQAELEPLLENLRSEIHRAGESLCDLQHDSQQQASGSSPELARLIQSLSKGLRDHREQQRKTTQIHAEWDAAAKQLQVVTYEYQQAKASVDDGLLSLGHSSRESALATLLSAEEKLRLEQRRRKLEELQADLKGRLRLSEEQQQRASEALAVLRPADDQVEAKIAELEQGMVQSDLELAQLNEQLGSHRKTLEIDAANRVKISLLQDKLEALRRDLEEASALKNLIGSANGDKFRKFAQQITLEQLIYFANHRLSRFAPRYQLASCEDLNLDVIDADLADGRRPAATLSGGESFLVSLALALGLADLKGGVDSVGSVFIDEGFGSLDSDSLDLALATLENVQNELGAQVIVISHVGELQDRWTDHIRVRRLGRGHSWLVVPGGPAEPPLHR